MQPTPENLLNSEADEALGIDSKAMIKAMSAGLLAETRRAVTGCWMTHRHLKGMESPVPILSALTIWMRDWDLMETDAKTAVEMMCSPDKMRGHKYGGDLMADLAEVVAELIRRRGRDKKLRSKSIEEAVPITELSNVKSILDEAIGRFGIPKEKQIPVDESPSDV